MMNTNRDAAFEALRASALRLRHGLPGEALSDDEWLEQLMQMANEFLAEALEARLAESRRQLQLLPHAMTRSTVRIETEREADGRFIAEVPELPGVLVYGATEAEARTKAIVLALRVIADRLEAGEPVPFDQDTLFAAVE
jgi:predicted RNase H-like HicB family nuclease